MKPRQNTSYLARAFTGAIRAPGRAALDLLREMGAMSLFLLNGLVHMFNSLSQLPKIVKQIHSIGARSFFLIVAIGLFTGMVLSLQGYYTLNMFGHVGLLGSAVSLGLIRELAPVLAAIMIAGRAGSAMAAEIGVMRITDQIDALEVMDINPVAYLFSPRISASIIIFPMLTAVFVVVGIFGGYITGVLMLDVGSGLYFDRIDGSVQWADVSGCLVKSLVFGIIVVTVSCYKGFFAHLRSDGKGAEAVGNATTAAVVLSSILILAADYVLTSFLL